MRTTLNVREQCERGSGGPRPDLPLGRPVLASRPLRRSRRRGRPSAFPPGSRRRTPASPPRPYWRGTATAFGMAPAPPGRFVDEVIDAPGSGPAGRSAALALWLTTQVPRRESVAVVGRAPRNPGPSSSSAVLPARSAETSGSRPAEAALLGVLRDWSVIVEVPERDAIRRIRKLVDDGTLRVDRLVRASATEPPRVRERLRRLLDALGRSTA